MSTPCPVRHNRCPVILKHGIAQLDSKAFVRATIE